MNRKSELKPGMYVKIPNRLEEHSTQVSKNKKYKVLSVELLTNDTFFFIENDQGEEILCVLNRCAFLRGGNWEIVKTSITDSDVYQALLYFLAGVGFGYLLFNVFL